MANLATREFRFGYPSWPRRYVVPLNLAFLVGFVPAFLLRHSQHQTFSWLALLIPFAAHAAVLTTCRTRLRVEPNALVVRMLGPLSRAWHIPYADISRLQTSQDSGSVRYYLWLNDGRRLSFGPFPLLIRWRNPSLPEDLSATLAVVLPDALKSAQPTVATAGGTGPGPAPRGPTS